ncbi:MAG: autotransporter outer membrane beta-barrel domain-containing protein, partial [Thermoguttaceae bacterium]
NHVINAGSINIANANSVFFGGVSVNNAPTLTLNGTLNGTMTRANSLMAVTQVGNTVSAAVVGTGDIHAAAVAQGGFTPAELAYFQQMETSRQTIIAGSDWTNPTILSLDEIFNLGVRQSTFLTTPVAPANGLTALTMTNNISDMVLGRQMNGFIDPQSNTGSALMRGQSCDPCGRALKCGSSRSYDIWFQGFAANMDVRSNVVDRAGYGVTRNGGIFGVNTSLGRKTTGGLVLGLSNPYFYGDKERLDLTDFQFGGNVIKQFGHNWEAGVYFGGGVQNGHTERNYFDTYQYNGGYNGNTLSASFMLSKIYRINKRLVLRPTAALDSEHAWYYNFTETSAQDVSASSDPAAALRNFGRNYYGRTMARLGVMAQTGGKKGGLNGRIFYSSQLGGDDYAIANMTLASGDLIGKTYQMKALPLGRDMVVIGLGGHVFLNKQKSFMLFGDYNANLFKHATTQTASVGLQKSF